MKRIVEIERASFARDAWRPELFLEYFHVAPELFLVARLGRRIAGYSIAQTNWRGAEIESIAVDPRFRSRGVAQALLNATIERLEDAKVLRLMVETANDPALRFYERFGFTRVRKVARYYGKGRDAWRMRLKL